MKEISKPEIVYQNKRENPGSNPWDDLKDADLVSRTLSGDDRAFEVLMNRYNSVVIWYLYGKTNSESDTEDLAQEVFLLAYRSLGSLHKRHKFFPWLMQIARRRLLSYYRYINRRPRLVVPEDPNNNHANNSLEQTPDQKASPRDQAYHKEFRQALSREIASMKEEYQLVLALRFINEYSSKEIALKLGMKEPTVRRRIWQGLKILRKSLIKAGFTPDFRE